MAPVLASLRFGQVTVPIYSYGTMVALALLVASGLFVAGAQRRGLEPGAVIAVSGAAVLGGFVGARTLFVAVQVLHGGDPILALVRGGLVFYGGLLGGLLSGGLAARALGLPAQYLCDLAIPPVCLGHAIGRIGCLLGGCCFGRPWDGPWAVTYRHPLAPLADGLPRHPVPVYEALALLVLAVASAAVPADRRRPGARLLGYALAYGVLRFALEGWRGDVSRGVFFSGWLSTSQAVSVGIAGAALGWLWWRRVAERVT